MRSLRRIKVETPTVKYPIIPIRAKCAQCGGLIKIEYHVKNEIWFEAVPRHLNNSRICLNCFMMWADEKFLPWDESIMLMPISFNTQRQIQIMVENGDYNTTIGHTWHTKKSD